MPAPLKPELRVGSKVSHAFVRSAKIGQRNAENALVVWPNSRTPWSPNAMLVPVSSLSAL